MPYSPTHRICICGFLLICVYVPCALKDRVTCPSRWDTCQASQLISGSARTVSCVCSFQTAATNAFEIECSLLCIDTAHPAGDQSSARQCIHCFTHHHDYSCCAGFPTGLDREEPDVLHAISRIVGACIENGIVASTMAGTPEFYKALGRQGFRYVALSMLTCRCVCRSVFGVSPLYTCRALRSFVCACGRQKKELDVGCAWPTYLYLPPMRPFATVTYALFLARRVRVWLCARVLFVAWSRSGTDVRIFQSAASSLVVRALAAHSFCAHVHMCTCAGVRVRVYAVLSRSSAVYRGCARS